MSAEIREALSQAGRAAWVCWSWVGLSSSACSHTGNIASSSHAPSSSRLVEEEEEEEATHEEGEDEEDESNGEEEYDEDYGPPPTQSSQPPQLPKRNPKTKDLLSPCPF